MRQIILFIIIFSYYQSYSQLISEFSRDEKGDMLFTEIVTVDSSSKDELYLNASSFFANQFKSANHVIQLQDKQAGVLIGKGTGKIYNDEDAVMTTVYNFNFTMRITVKDNRYKYEIYGISFFTQPALPYYPNGVQFSQHDMFDSTVYYKSNGKPKPRFEKSKNALIKSINDIVNSLNREMKVATKRDEW